MEHIEDKNHLQEIAERELENDKVYEFIKNKGLEKEVFNPSLFNNVIPDVPYLTSDFEKLHCTDEQSDDFLCKPSVMRQFVKDLNRYLNVNHIGRTVTVDFLGFIKLKMVLVLRKDGMKPSILLELARLSYGKNKIIDAAETGTLNVVEPSNIEESRKQEIRNNFIDALISYSQSTGALKRNGSEFFIEGLFDSNNYIAKLDDADRIREREILNEMYQYYKNIKAVSSIEDMESMFLEMKDKYYALEADSIEAEGYLVRAEEYIESKKLLQLNIEIQQVERDALSAISVEDVKGINERFEELEFKYKDLSEHVLIAKSKWINHIEVMNKNNEVTNFELHVVDVLSDIAEGKFTKKEALQKISDLEEGMKQQPRINMGLKISMINAKKELETGFFKKLFR